MRRHTTVGAVLISLLALAASAHGKTTARPEIDLFLRLAAREVGRFEIAYRRTPPAERVTWGGLAACGLLAALTVLRGTLRLRTSRLIPDSYIERFHARLVDGRLDRAKALDYCEVNPSPAAGIALAAIRRWGRPAADIERAVVLARRAEIESLTLGLKTLRRIAVLAPLVGLLGTLTTAARALSAVPAGIPSGAWGPAVAAALGPLTVGVAMAILALVAFDGLAGRVERLSGRLDRLAAEAADAVASHSAFADARSSRSRLDAADPAQSPQPYHVQLPDEVVRPTERDRRS